MKKFISIVTAVILIICGGLLVGCGDPYSDLSLSFDEDSIVLYVGEDGLHTVKVENYFEDVSLMFDIQGNVATVTKCEYINNGNFAITIKPLIDDTINSNLKITIKGTDKSIIIPLHISLRIQSVALDYSPYIVKRINAETNSGEVLDLSRQNYTYTPSSTYQTGLSFSLNDQKFNGKIEIVKSDDPRLSQPLSEDSPLYISEDYGSGQNESSILNIKAESIYHSEIFTMLSVHVVNEINKEQINLFEFDPKDNGKTRQIFEYDDTKADNDYLELTLNQKDYSTKTIQVQRQLTPPFYVYDIAVGSFNAQSVLTLDCVTSTTQTGLDGTYSFKLSATDVSDCEFITVTLYSKDYPAYTETKTYLVKCILIPAEIRINNSKNPASAELYDTNTAANAKSYSISVYEQQASVSGFDVEFYTLTENGGNITHNAATLENILEYVYLVVNDVQITTETDLESALKTSAINDVQIYGKQQTETTFAISFMATSEYGRWQEDNKINYQKHTISNELRFVVHHGAEKFDVADDYKQDGRAVLYIERGKTEVFGRTYDETTQTYKDAFDFGDNSQDVYIGEIYATPSLTSVGICTVVQYYEAGQMVERSIEITALEVGTANFTLKIDSGKILPITIIVVEPLNLNQTYVTFEANSAVANYTYADLDVDADGINVQSLSELVVNGSEKQIKLILNTNQNADLYEIESYETDRAANILLNISDLSFVTLLNNEAYVEAKLTLKLNVYGIENFKKVALTVNGQDLSEIAYQIKVTIFKPIGTFSFKAKNINNAQGQFADIVDVYSYSKLGYHDKTLSKIQFQILRDDNLEALTTTNTSVGKTPVNNMINFSFSISSSPQRYNGIDAYLLSYGPTSYGYFYIAEDGYAYFECTKDFIEENDSFKVYAEIIQYGKTYSGAVTINVKDYVKPEGVWLKNYVDYIYLDSRDTYSSFNIYPYIMPLDVINKEIVAIYRATKGNSANSVKVTKIDNGFEVAYTGTGSGEGEIYLIPLSSYTSETEYQDNYITLKVVIADGLSEESPIYISSYEELEAIVTSSALSKHYAISQMIDCGNRTLQFGNLTGSITGLVNGKQIGGITNFVVSKTNLTGNGGLFAKIEHGATLSYLTISGTFNVSDTSVNGAASSYNIGLVAGENIGTIKNVNVTINKNAKDDISLTATKDTNVGLLVGKNSGEIVVDNLNADNLLSTLFVSTKNTRQNPLVVMLGTKSNFGGVVGLNDENGVIKTSLKNIHKVNLYGTNVSVYISATAKYVGSVAGTNKGDINNIVAVGEISDYAVTLKNTASSTTIGGLVGYMSAEVGKLENNTSRVFVRSFYVVSGLVGEIGVAKSIDAAALTIKDNIVQAVDDGTRYKADASLIVLYYTGETVAKDNVNIFAKVVASGDNGQGIPETIKTQFNELLQKNNQNETYFAEYTIESGNIILKEDSRRLVKTGNIVSLNEYYGDVIACKLSGDVQQIDGTNFTLLSSGKSEALGLTTTEVILQMYKAKEASLQEYLSDKNKIDPTAYFEELKDKEYVVEISSGDCLDILTNGQLQLKNLGLVELKITNSLNYKDTYTVYAFVTNRAEKIAFYSSIDGKNLISESAVVEVGDTKNVVIYPKITAKAPTDALGHLFVELEENKDLTLVASSDSQNDLDIIVSADYVSIKAKTGTDKRGIVITFKATYVLNGKTFYLVFDEQNNQSSFISQEDSATIGTVKVNAKSGIYDLSIDKNNITNVIPSESINFVVSYKTTNANDTIKLIASDGLGNVFEETEKEGITYLSNGLMDLYVVTKTEPSLVGDTYTVKYTLKLNKTYAQTNINYLTNKELLFSFSSKYTGEIKSANVSYMAEPVKSVMIKNFDSSANGILYSINNNNQKYYNAKNSLIATDTIVSGDTNILKIYIDSPYSNFEYVDITVAENSSYFANINLLTKDDAITGDYCYKLASDTSYLANGIRIHKLNQNLEITENYLVITLCYRLPSEIDDGTVITFNVNFLDSSLNQVAETFAKELVTKRTRLVTMQIQDKTATSKDDTSNVISYDVARGYTYLLNVNAYGFTDDEITILTSSPYASVQIVNGEYVLKIADNIVYSSLSADGGENVLVYAYGTKIVEGKKVESSRYYMYLTIYDYVFDRTKGLAGLFENAGENLNLALSTTTDIREVIANLINIECSPLAKDSLTRLASDFMQNVYFAVVDNGIEYNLSGASNYGITDYFFKNYKFTPYKIYSKAPYNFVIRANVKFSMGRLVFETENLEATEINTKTFGAEIYSVASTKNPTPVATLKDLYSMKAGGNYRLVSDITINHTLLSQIDKTTFTPIDAAFASFDGNGYSICLQDIFRYVDLSEFGLFSEISESSIVKNLNIKIAGTFTVYVDNYATSGGVTLGLLAGVNRGTIYNCSVSYDKNFACLFNINSQEESLLGGLVGTNEGYITNSRVSVRLTANGTSVAGFVGKNDKHISSSYVAKSNITNASGTVDSTSIAGGFAIYNNGEIYSSYIKGEQSRTASVKIYSQDRDYALYSNNRVGGFVYENAGLIQDAYSDIPIISSSFNAGFAYVNIGTITRVYSTSKLESSQSVNYPFVYEYQKGKFSDCFFLKDADRNVNNNTSPLNDNLKDIGITKLSVKNFCDMSYFKNFSVSDISKDKAVWFMPKNDSQESITSPDSGFSYLCQTNLYQQYDYSSNTFENMTFVARRLELVSANIIAVSRYEINNQNTKTDADTGEIIYAYDLVSTAALVGTKYNPNAISSAEELENVVYGNSAQITTYSSVRIIKDIDYEAENIKTSNLFKKSFVGDIDGNNLSISGYVINYSQNLQYLGFIGNIGGDFSTSQVKTLSLYPKYINAPNAIYAGVLTGFVKNTVVFDVNVKENVTLVARNIVGGLVGYATGECEIANLETMASVKSTYLKTNNLSIDNLNAITITSGTQKVAIVSYAGGVVGYSDGSVVIKNITTNKTAQVQGTIAGLIVGGMSQNTTVSDISVNLVSQSVLGAAFACGYVAGESAGKIDNVKVQLDSVQNYYSAQSTVKEMYNSNTKNPITTNFKPVVVGGFVGIMRAGQISNFKLVSPVIAKDSQVVGGLVGLSLGGEISNGTVVTTLCGKQVVGGIIGQVQKDAKPELTNVNLGIYSFELNTITKKLSSDITALYIGICVGYNLNGTASSGVTLINSNFEDDENPNLYKTNSPDNKFIISIEASDVVTIRVDELVGGGYATGENNLNYTKLSKGTTSNDITSQDDKYKYTLVFNVKTIGTND